MKMRFPFLFRPATLPILAGLLGVWLVFAWQPVVAQGEGTGSSVRDDRYLDAYMTYNEGERLERAGQLEVALKKYREASQVFDLLFTGYPGWEVEKLTMRRRKVSEAITRVEAVLSRPPVVSSPASAALTVPASPQEAPAQPGLMTPGAVGGPPALGAWTGTAPSVSPAELPSITEFFRQYELQWREKVDALQRKNSEMDGALKKWDEWYRWASGEIKAARGEKEALAGQMGEMDKRVQQLQRQVEAGQASQDQLDTLLKEKAALLALEKQNAQRLQAAQTAAGEAAQKVEAANAQLLAFQKEREALIQERDAAMAERDAAVKEKEVAVKDKEVAQTKQAALEAELAGMKSESGPEEIKKLTTENERLRGELETAQKQIVALRDDVTKKEAELTALKADLGEIRTQLSALQKENMAYQTQVSELTSQLKELQNAPDMTKAEEGGQLASENTLLRGVILRQLRVQARQQQAKALVIEELKKLEGASEALLAQVSELDAARLTLSEEEVGLFTDPQMQQLLKDGGSSAVQATLIASGEGAEGPSEGTVGPATEGGTMSSPKSPLPTNEPLTVQALLQQAQTALVEKRFDAAIQGFDEVLRADPKNASALIGVGDAYQRSGRYADAEVALKKCLAYEPDNAAAYYLLGMTLFRDNRLNDAMTAFEDSLKRDAKQHLAHHYLGIIASRLKQGARAEKEFRTALAISPEFGEAHFNLSVLYVTWEPPQMDKARAEYDSAIAKGVTSDENLERLLKP